MRPPPPISTLFPYTTLFRSRFYEGEVTAGRTVVTVRADDRAPQAWEVLGRHGAYSHDTAAVGTRSEEHTSELQSRVDLVCRLLLEKKKKKVELRRCDKTQAG